MNADYVHGQRFTAKNVLITGAGQGIGLATAMRFAVEGAGVGLLDRNFQTLRNAEALIKMAGADCLTLSADVAETSQARQAVLDFIEYFGRIDVLVNNAGFDKPGAFLKLNQTDFMAVWSVHVLGTVNCSQAAAGCMMEKGSGAMVNVSSIYGRIGSKGESAYSTAKAGLIGLTRSLAKEFGPKGIRVNAVLPGLTLTPTIDQFMAEKFKNAIIAETPLGRPGRADEVAAAIAFLSSEDASFITGACLDVSGGWGIG